MQKFEATSEPSRRRILKGIAIGALALALTGLASQDSAHAQARVDLEDLDVKGELLNDNRLRMTARDAIDVGDRIHYRKDFRPEIIDGLDLRIPASETEQLKSSIEPKLDSKLEGKP
ncbi:MAG TPA: twin-arginine translocation signal domain-containing protein [Pseudobdellovibrionaceae bacterium]|nr:twin-arginine translocation signal domain-containing protein [Pseudobdellovibrionaceae bacterium]